ncbi:ATP-binding protein [Streptomyces pactum]|uniref:ATP-binding protein n=1 Tax=Streptomyces pactum TaxID=68249 RepID=A0ABS0NLJ0_9ACTN|nr:ATP-binding protein [Streptomyces pactum]MBH5336065.1 ATP-binding protein [Streptomyces pactum]
MTHLLAVPSGSESYRLTGPRTPRLPSIARDFLARVLPSTVPVDPDTLYAAKVCVSELVTNALRHTTTPAITIETTVGQDRCVVHVHDNSPDPPLLGRATLDREHGRGLALVERYAETWGSALYGGASPTHKSVWFRIALRERAR